MCGILGVVGAGGPDDATVLAMRDLMSARGPDGAGLWRGPGLVLAHRRLAVVEPGACGAQPMTLPDGSSLVYNGELYNDAEVRAALSGRGVRFSGRSDAETVLRALREWGPGAIPRLRGMYALAFFDGPGRRLILSRDPLGIKPLYYWLGERGGRPCLVFASDPRAVLALPGLRPRPDMAVVSAYLTTIRTVLGSRTLFEGVRAVRPGETIEFGLASGPGVLTRSTAPIAGSGDSGAGGAGTGSVRALVEDSVRRHLRADVPVCCLLSGGLDSSIIASIVAGVAPGLRTYCAGAMGDTTSEDFGFARRVAERLGTAHTEVGIDRELFCNRWGWMVRQTGLPLSTPNEVAIHEVSRRLRADGHVVALSGEGADELFGGYEGPLVEAGAFCRSARTVEEAARFHLDSAAWLPVGAKAGVLTPDAWRALEGDGALIDAYAAEFEQARLDGQDDDALASHLRFHRRINLTGLLQRLDTAAMLAGVEGRTPFADAVVAGVAESLPMSRKFVEGPPARTKIALREAFAHDLPPEVVSRPKASFPLPFQEWAGGLSAELEKSDFARSIFSEAAIATVSAHPARLWRMAWPMINLAMWGRRWWG